MIVLTNVLTREEAGFITGQLNSVTWQTGRTLDTYYQENIKKNLELRASDDPRVSAVIKLISDKVYNSPAFQEAAFPKRIITPRFNCSKEGGFYGAHSDAGVMGDIRTDLASTLWLTDDYDGGELLIDGPEGQKAYKGQIGDLVVYPAHYVHQTLPVTRGERICCITWMQSFLRDEHKREYMRRFLHLSQKQKASYGHTAEYVEMTSLYNNLFRLWAE